ncbi:alpha carbonic anhydrase [Artemisia annua]|uniref:Alpha carbonic anhydrase n=1 Tax=Artemisia annua TaxID=35608 RepID=A0A2U1P2D5_ARTAN|nr:alpha carbonic anhydrase [Artemisia annua]
MKNMQSSSFLALGFLLFMLILSHPSSTQAQEVEDEREFDYARGGHMGPEKWGEIKEEWAHCSNGTMQSPIDMSSRRVEMIRTVSKDQVKLLRDAVQDYAENNARPIQADNQRDVRLYGPGSR